MSDLFFSGWAELVRTLVVGTMAYFAVVPLLRRTGKRALTKMRAYDFVITVALGSSLATALLSSQVKLDKASDWRCASSWASEAVCVALHPVALVP